jgi:ferric iron reductase protein FhuF
MSTTSFTSVLAEIGARASYLRAVRLGSPASTDSTVWHGVQSLIDDPETLGALVASTAAGRGAAAEPDVALSLFVQAYSFRVAGVAVAAHVLGLPSPSLNPSNVAITVDRHRPSGLGYVDDTPLSRTDDELAHELNVTHFEPFVATARQVTRIGARLLWGNIAASCVTAIRAMDTVGSPDVRARGERLVAAAAPWFQGLGHFTTLVGEARTGWYWDRTNCCLWYHTAPGRYCDDCSLVDPAERNQRRMPELAVVAS